MPMAIAIGTDPISSIVAASGVPAQANEVDIAGAIEADLKVLADPMADRFLVGYGLDHAEKYRNLDYIAVLDGE